MAQLVKNPPAIQETPVWFMGREDALEKKWATHSSILGLPLWLSCMQVRKKQLELDMEQQTGSK